jgi:predicted metalloendopeptidase
VGENIADNGGIRETFKAYQFYSQRSEGPQRLPYVSKYSPEQLLFLSFANVSQNKFFMSLNIYFFLLLKVWCGLERTEFLKDLIQYNPHSPGKYRVNVPLSNFKTF